MWQHFLRDHRLHHQCCENLNHVLTNAAAIFLSTQKQKHLHTNAEQTNGARDATIHY
jgi:hypothetical protein